MRYFTPSHLPHRIMFCHAAYFSAKALLKASYAGQCSQYQFLVCPLCLFAKHTKWHLLRAWRVNTTILFICTQISYHNENYQSFTHSGISDWPCSKGEYQFLNLVMNIGFTHLRYDQNQKVFVDGVSCLNDAFTKCKSMAKSFIPLLMSAYIWKNKLKRQIMEAESKSW